MIRHSSLADQRCSDGVTSVPLLDELAGERLALSFGPRRCTLDPAHGARLCSLTLDGAEALLQPDVHPENFGSTFWDAPQSAWNWPPRAALDRGPYQPVPSAGLLGLRSAPDPATGLVCEKHFDADPTLGLLHIRYRLINTGPHMVAVAPWEVTRVAGGLTCFPVAPASGLPQSGFAPTGEADGLLWLHFDPAQFVVGRKLFRAARQGWLAHRLPDGIVLLKVFPALAAAACAGGHAPVELWGQDGGIYLELETHGALSNLPPGASLDYPVVWYVGHPGAGQCPADDAHALARWAEACVTAFRDRGNRAA